MFAVPGSPLSAIGNDEKRLSAEQQTDYEANAKGGEKGLARLFTSEIFSFSHEVLAALLGLAECFICVGAYIFGLVLEIGFELGGFLLGAGFEVLGAAFGSGAQLAGFLTCGGAEFLCSFQCTCLGCLEGIVARDCTEAGVRKWVRVAHGKDFVFPAT
jgi:hypothetical protein